MDGVEVRGLSKLSEGFDGVLSKFPDIRRKEMEAVAEKLKESVDRTIGGTGKVKSWQESHVGTGGGYAAVRPKKNDDADDIGYYGRAFLNIGKYSFIGITAAVEHGHRTRKGYKYVLSKHGKKMKRRNFGERYVPGKHMYYKAQNEAETLAKQIKDRLEKRMTNLLEVK